MLNRYAIAVFFALLFIVPTAFAQEIAANTRISLAPLFDYLINTLIVVTPPIVLLLIRHYLNKSFGVKLDAGSAAALQIAIEKGVSMGLGRLRMLGKDVENVNVHNELVATAANYALAQVPDAIARFGMTPNQLKDMALARLEERLNPKPIVIPSPST